MTYSAVKCHSSDFNIAIHDDGERMEVRERENENALKHYDGTCHNIAPNAHRLGALRMRNIWLHKSHTTVRGIGMGPKSVRGNPPSQFLTRLDDPCAFRRT